MALVASGVTWFVLCMNQDAGRKQRGGNNELADAAGMAHLLKYDTSHGRFAWDVRQEREQLIVGDDTIRILHERTLDALPWRELSIDVVLDCTGVYGNREHGEAHLARWREKSALFTSRQPRS